MPKQKWGHTCVLPLRAIPVCQMGTSRTVWARIISFPTSGTPNGCAECHRRETRHFRWGNLPAQGKGTHVESKSSHTIGARRKTFRMTNKAKQTITNTVCQLQGTDGVGMHGEYENNKPRTISQLPHRCVWIEMLHCDSVVAALNFRPLSPYHKA